MALVIAEDSLFFALILLVKASNHPLHILGATRLTATKIGSISAADSSCTHNTHSHAPSVLGPCFCEFF
jgi:hypothetical protein